MHTIDQKTLKKVLKGDRRILDEVYEAYFREISRFVRLKVKTQDLADDITADVFTKTFEYVIRGNTIDNVRAFLYQVSRNQLALHYRDRKIELELFEDESDRSATSNNIIINIDFSIDWDKVEKVLEQLREDWREIVFLRFLEEHSYEEISSITGKSEGSIRVIIHRAIQQLKESSNIS